MSETTKQLWVEGQKFKTQVPLGEATDRRWWVHGNVVYCSGDNGFIWESGRRLVDFENAIRTGYFVPADDPAPAAIIPDTIDRLRQRLEQAERERDEALADGEKAANERVERMLQECEAEPMSDAEIDQALKIIGDIAAKETIEKLRNALSTSEAEAKRLRGVAAEVLQYIRDADFQLAERLLESALAPR